MKIISLSAIALLSMTSILSPCLASSSDFDFDSVRYTIKITKPSTPFFNDKLDEISDYLKQGVVLSIDTIAFRGGKTIQTDGRSMCRNKFRWLGNISGKESVKIMALYFENCDDTDKQYIKKEFAILDGKYKKFRLVNPIK